MTTKNKKEVSEKEVVNTQTGEITIFGGNAGEVANYAADMGAGNENIAVDDLSTPRIVLLQALSQPVKDRMEGAFAGVFHNSVTDELFEEKFLIPVHFIREYAIFDDDRNFHGTFETNEDAEAGLLTLKEGVVKPKVYETHRHTVLTLTDKGEVDKPAIIHYSNTALTVSRKWNSTLQMTLPDNAPRFAGVWKLAAEERSKGKDQWFVPHFSFVGLCPQSLYDAAKELYELSANKKAA